MKHLIAIFLMLPILAHAQMQGLNDAINFKDTEGFCYMDPQPNGNNVICEIQARRGGDVVYHFENTLKIKQLFADLNAGVGQNGRGKLILKEKKRGVR